MFNMWTKKSMNDTPLNHGRNTCSIYSKNSIFCTATINFSLLILCFESDANWIVTITWFILSVPVIAVQGQLYHSWIRNSLNITLISIPLSHSVVLIFTIWLKDQGFIRYFSGHKKSRIFLFTLTHFKCYLSLSTHKNPVGTFLS